MHADLKMKSHAKKVLRVDEGNALWFWVLTERLNMVLQTTAQTLGLKQAAENKNDDGHSRPTVKKSAMSVGATVSFFPNPTLK